jgi:hypothetical protein
MIKRNRNWWAIINKETGEIVDVFPTRDRAREFIWEYNYAYPTHNIEKVYIISESEALSEAQNSDM